MGFSTRAVHSGYPGNDPHQASIVPLYQSIAFGYEDPADLSAVFKGQKPGYSYTRSGNPTVTCLENRVTAIENARGTVAVNAGIGAIACVFQTLARAGDHVVCSQAIFGGTFRLFTKNIIPNGVEMSFVDMTDADAVSAAIQDNTQFIFTESIGNPKLDVPNLRQLSGIAEAAGIPLVVDSTMSPPCMMEAKALGVHILAYSTTKFISLGATGGLIVDTGRFDWKTSKSANVQEMYKQTGPMAFLAFTRKFSCGTFGVNMQPNTAYLAMLGIETLALKVQRQSENALALAQFLEAHPAVTSVNYPGLASSPYHEVAASQFVKNQYGAVMTLRLESQERCFEVMKKLKLFSNMANFGDTKSIMIHPFSTIFAGLSEDIVANAGVTDDLIRLSIGVEELADLVQDFEQATRRNQDYVED